jgi:DNA polymerase bacteriophage-type
VTRLYLDIETFSPEPITNGTHRYAEAAEVMIRALALDDRPVIVRDLTPGGADWMLDDDRLVPAPADYVDEIDDALADPTVDVWIHNSHFDRTVEAHAGLDLPLARVRDTMVQAIAHSLPGGLDALCEVLKIGTDKAKDKAGKALIQLFCKPVKFRFRKRYPAGLESPGEYAAEKAKAQAAWDGRATRETHPAEWERFLIYAGQDINAMRAVQAKLPKWNYPNNSTELALWQLDQRINDRGVAIDLELAEAAVRAVDRAQVALKARAHELTNGEVDSATRRDAMLLHVLAEYGVDLPDLQMATLERRIADPDLPEGLRELLRIRLQASTTSTSKYKVLMRATSSDGRLRGLLQFCGASRTGRWAGRLFQPQNLPRPVLKQSVIDTGIDALKSDCADLLFDNVMELTSSAIRGCIIAPTGRKLAVADLSNIEGRVLAWLAGERWKLRAFADFDAGTGFDLYALAYAKSFGVTPQSVMEDKKAGGNQRQIGKVQELALGYEGGVGAFLTFAAAYGIDLEELAQQAFRAIPQDVMAQANIMFEWHRDKKKKDPAAAMGLSKQAWLVCESFKLAWRAAHQEVVQFWRDIDNAVRAAITQPSTTYTCRMLKVRRDGAWLRIGLPSGRALCYPSPEIEDGTITYMGVHQYSRKWTRLSTYGGKLAENITQAVARDVMAANMPGIETAGYHIVLSVHDELLTETPDKDDYSAASLSELLSAVPEWAPGLPLAAAGFEAYRYKKD